MAEHECLTIVPKMPLDNHVETTLLLWNLELLLCDYKILDLCPA